MNANAYSEDQMIQAGTADFFAEHLDWRSVYAFDREDLGADSLLGRSHRGEVVLLRGLRQALKKLNPKAARGHVEGLASRAQVETAILDHLYEELPETFDENEVRPLSARVLGLLNVGG